MARISMEVEGQLLPRFAPLLSKGVIVRARTGCSLRDFVSEQLGVPEPYLEQRIQTIFLNGKAVDDYTTATVTDGASLALSAAMPGLVGATFRKGGNYGWMRKAISHERDGKPDESNHGWVKVKLFNLVLKELGPEFLKRGVWIERGRVQAFIKNQPQEFRQHVQALPLDGTPLSTDAFLEQDLSDTSIFLNVRSFAE